LLNILSVVNALLWGADGGFGSDVAGAGRPLRAANAMNGSTGFGSDQSGFGKCCQF